MEYKTTTNIKGNKYKVDYVHIECPDCKAKDKKIRELELELVDEKDRGETILRANRVQEEIIEAKNMRITNQSLRINELKQNQFEVIASGKVTEDLPKLDIYFIKGKQVNSMFKKYSGKNIILGVKVIGKV